jgi:hypothetical protein
MVKQLILNRRSFTLSALATLALPKAGLAQVTTFTPEAILFNLERSIWLSTNRKATKAAYVVAAPWCPFCHQLHEVILATRPDVDFRFVFMGQHGPGGALANAFFSDADDQVGPVFADPRARNAALSPRADVLIDEVNTVAGHLMADSFAAVSTGAGGTSAVGGFAYPLTVQREAGGSITANLGAWMMLEELVARTAVETAPPPPQARYADLLRLVPELNPYSRNHFAKANGVPLFAAPVPDAAEVEWLEEGQGYKMIGTLTFGGADWLAVRAFTSGDAMKWARAEDFFTQ